MPAHEIVRDRCLCPTRLSHGVDTAFEPGVIMVRGLDGITGPWGQSDRISERQTKKGWAWRCRGHVGRTVRQSPMRACMRGKPWPGGVTWHSRTVSWGHHASVRALPAPRRGGVSASLRSRAMWVAVRHSGIVLDTGVLYRILHQMSIVNIVYINNISLSLQIRTDGHPHRIISTSVRPDSRSPTHRDRS